MTTAVDDDVRAALRRELERARARTLALLDLPEAVQREQVSHLMSPMVWDLAHVGNYEELWLLRAVDGRAPVDPELDDLYNAFEHPRWERPSLPILGPAEARRYLDDVRTDVLDLLEHVDLGPEADDELRRHGVVWSMVVQHEHQHDETLLATRQLLGERATPPPGTSPWAGSPQPPSVDRVRFDGGTVVIGTDDPRTYDNERPAHEVELAPFRLATTPVTNRAWQAFLADGGYDEPALWTERGWAWRQEAGLAHPGCWRRADGGWERLRFGTWAEVDPDEPVQHICWFEADAFARWSGARLPTEHELEHATRCGIDGAARRYPWGDDDPVPQLANLGQRHDGPAPVGAFPAGASPQGVHGLIGDVWEWTSSDFHGWPGFRAFPYREYSEVFFGGDYKVLRGGSWATDRTAIRGTFRNWDHPIRRQIFSGARLAWDDD